MKRTIVILVTTLLAAVARSGDTNYAGRVVVQSSDTPITCSTASTTGGLCVESASEFQSTLLITGATTLGAALSCGDNNVTNVGDIDIDTLTPDGASWTGDDMASMTSAAADPADAGVLRLGNAEDICWEADATGTDECFSVESDEEFNFTSAVEITGNTLTSGGTDDYGLEVLQTLNDTGAAGGSDEYRAIVARITSTDVTGWDTVYMLDLQDDASSVFSVTQAGAVVTAGSITAGGDVNGNGNTLYGQLTGFEDLTGDDTMAVSDCGKTVTTNDSGRVITLPDAAAGNIGCRITFIVTAADDNGIVSISPHTSDGIYGQCCGVNDAATTACVALSGAANKDLEDAAAEQNKGDSVTLVSDGSTGWYTVGCIGSGWGSES
jgi:hypothetical protein